MPSDRREDVFRQWLGLGQGLMLKVARSFATGREDQEDLLQEILMQVWRSIPSFAERSEASTWIYKVALNTAIAWRRGNARRRPFRCLADAEDVPDWREAGPTDAEDRETLERLYAAIRLLPKVDRSLLLLYLDSRNYGEMSEIMGISEANVGARLTRARKRLAEAMKGADHGP